MDKDLDNCRECGHFRFLHEFKGIGTHVEKGFAFTQACDPQNDHGCNCKEFMPEDNLDYIEWLAKKRNLV